MSRNPVSFGRVGSRISGVGVGLRSQHYRHFLSEHVPVDWLEVHSENYFGDGGYDLFVLQKLRENYPVSLHGVGLGLGSAHNYRIEHIAKLQRLIERVDPGLVSEHLCWGAIAGRHVNDLLPLALNNAAFELFAARVSDLQDRLRRRIYIENVSTYVRFIHDDMDEIEFLSALVKHTGCGILLDVNNLYVNQMNHGEDALQALNRLALLPASSIGEIHLAGHTQTELCLVDDHGSCVSDSVWTLFAHASELLGQDIPVLIEWDTDIPDISVLLAEAKKVPRYQNGLVAGYAV